MSDNTKNGNTDKLESNNAIESKNFPSNPKESKSTSIENNTKNLINSILFVSISKIISQLLFFLMRYVFLLNWLPDTDIADMIIYFRYLELFLSLNIIGQYTLPKFLSDSKISLNSLINNSISIIFFNVMLLIFGFLGYFLFFPENDFGMIQALASPLNFILFIVGAIAFLFQRQFEYILLGLKQGQKIFFANLIFSVVYCLTLFIFVRIQMMGYLGAILAYFIANLCAFILELIVFLRYYKTQQGSDFKYKFDLNLVQTKSILKFSFPLFLAGALYYFTYRMNSLFITNNDIESLIYYDTSVSLILYLIGFIGAPIQDAIFPYLAESINQNNSPKEIINYDKENNIIYSQKQYNGVSTDVIFQIMNFIVCVLIIGAALVFFSFCESLYEFVYPDFNHNYFAYITRLLLIGGIFYILNQFYGRIPIAKGKSRVLFISQAFAAGSNLIFLIIYSKTNDLIFLILGFIIASLIQFIYYYQEVVRYPEISFKFTLLPQILVCVSLTILEFYILSNLIQNQFFLTIIIFLSYLLFLFLFRIIKLDVIKSAIGIIKNRPIQI